MTLRPPLALALVGLAGLAACATRPECADSACEAIPSCPDSAFDEAAMRADVAYLASEALDGRAPGTPGDDAARAFLHDRFACLGLRPLPGAPSFEQAFTDSEGHETANVVGYLPGADAGDASDIVVVSAHFDHLGDGRLGANDNASGVSGLLAIAQALSEAEPTQRTVVFAAFGAEESGMEGAAAFLDTPPEGFSPDDVVYDVNMDMIGTYADTGTVYALGSLAGTEGRAAVAARRAEYPELDVGLGEPSDLSDNEAFCSRGIPYLFFWTEDPDCYHSRCDVPDQLDYPSMVEIARLTGQVAADLADSDADLRGAVAPGTDVCDRAGR